MLKRLKEFFISIGRDWTQMLYEIILDADWDPPKEKKQPPKDDSKKPGS